jgi:hypothetical protein
VSAPSNAFSDSRTVPIVPTTGMDGTREATSVSATIVVTTVASERQRLAVTAQSSSTRWIPTHIAVTAGGLVLEGLRAWFVPGAWVAVFGRQGRRWVGAEQAALCTRTRVGLDPWVDGRRVA